MPAEYQLRSVLFLPIEFPAEIQISRFGRRYQVIESELVMALALESEKVFHHPDQAVDCDIHTGFLAHLADNRGFGPLVDFNVSAGKEPEVVGFDAKRENVLALNCDRCNAEIELPAAALERDHCCGRGCIVSLPRTAGARAPVTVGMLPWRPRSI